MHGRSPGLLSPQAIRLLILRRSKLAPRISLPRSPRSDIACRSPPDHVARDPIFEERTRYYARDVGPSRWLLVVVSYEQQPARIVSAFANRKDPKSWSA